MEIMEFNMIYCGVSQHNYGSRLTCAQLAHCSDSINPRRAYNIKLAQLLAALLSVLQQFHALTATVSKTVSPSTS